MPTTAAVESVEDFAREPDRYLKRLQTTGQPIYLTSNGQERYVVVDALAFRESHREISRLQRALAIREALQDAADGKSRPIQEFLAEFEAEMNIPVVPGR